MTYQNAHLVVRVNGAFTTVPGAPDRWSCGLRVGIPGQDIRYDASALQTFANAVHAAALTCNGSAGMAAGTTCALSHITVARVGENGKYLPAEQLTTVSVGGTNLGSGTPTQPWSASLAFGLRTAVPRGYASNGRVYWPMLSPSIVSSTGRLNTATVTNRLNAFATFLRAVNTAAAGYDLGALVCVMSNVGLGTTRAVTAIRSDERLDAIERRENDQPPNYSTVNL